MSPVSINKFRTQWREVFARIEALEKHQKETDGIIDVLLADSEYKADPDLGMNGQHRRKEVVSELFSVLSPDLVIETGTYLGATTGYFATQFQVPIYSSELVPRNHHVARRLLRSLSDVHLCLQDSRSFLQSLTTKPDITSAKPFFYLDAHWYDDLPLADEMEIIAQNWSQYVILIDDFQIAGDEGYEYDDYGPGMALTMEYLKPVISKYELLAYYPKADSAQETGRKRGYVVVAPPELGPQLESCTTLRLT